jgi:hypothetical protein
MSEVKENFISDIFQTKPHKTVEEVKTMLNGKDNRWIFDAKLIRRRLIETSFGEDAHKEDRVFDHCRKHA